MIFLRKILFPLAGLYALITAIRNFLYDKNLLASQTYSRPIIAVGNLSVGGTGKSPQIEYLIRLLSESYQVAVLSRGYKRKSEGFVLADENASAETLGDEPYQFYRKFPKILVAVDANRNRGIQNLLALPETPDVILLDDAYQHRKVKAGFYILLTAYGDLFCDDYVLPVGNLREPKNGVKRADLIVVTKCPTNLSEQHQLAITAKLGVGVPVFFSSIAYGEAVCSESKTLKMNELQSLHKLLIAGIAKPEPFFAYLQQQEDVVLKYPDHHHFTSDDIEKITKLSQNRVIVTTEKDYVRLIPHMKQKALYYLPIKTSFLQQASRFDQIILNYVGTSTTNR
ncbi:tetraacyldisaccharide 4'-kinase [Flavobacterium sp. CYK-55]|uniref:tetraacyldisaccharide 4'-kinase n=1 Tax=Flavobacterium sp. CYK-55 TaxID=2835529 RepID=UPI001BCD58DC|nr:tetraacyldisaccharide 4'-kinase [Flavobacterium sp. CYK-55]MBS7786331.1 tetraacyldisaccharide 4'-kinase [Flavobacterium sp. CYK-55]